VGDYLFKAIEIADKAHAGKFRRDGVTPYFNHPKAVALHPRIHGDPAAMAVAYLHDVIEDAGIPADRLKNEGIPDEVVDAVVVLTHKRDQTYREYLEGVKKNALAAKVKVVDMLHNLSDTPTDRQILKYAKGLKYLMED
jgi:(p)ppGpp synthase/HD superfamily hydrolase